MGGAIDAMGGGIDAMGGGIDAMGGGIDAMGGLGGSPPGTCAGTEWAFEVGGGCIIGC